MNGIRSYMTELCAITFLIAIVNAIAPKNNAAKVCTMLGSILLIAVLISPIHKIDASELSRMEGRYSDDIKLQISQMNEKYAAMEKRIIEERLATYVLNKANVAGDNCGVKIEISENIPVSAEVYADNADAYGSISRVLERELLIPKEKIKKEEK